MPELPDRVKDFLIEVAIKGELHGRIAIHEKPERTGGAGRLANLGLDPEEWYADSGDIFPWGPERGWAERGACCPHNNNGQNITAWFFPDPEAPERWRRHLADPRAETICKMCPVQQECGEYGEKIKAPTGMWGGIDRGLPAWLKLQAKEAWKKGQE